MDHLVDQDGSIYGVGEVQRSVQIDDAIRGESRTDWTVLRQPYKSANGLPICKVYRRSAGRDVPSVTKRYSVCVKGLLRRQFRR